MLELLINNDDIKTSSVNGVKQQSNDGDSSSGSSLNTRPEPPTTQFHIKDRELEIKLMKL